MNALRLCFRTIGICGRTLQLNYEGQRHYKRWFAQTMIQITKLKKISPPPVTRRNEFLEWNRDAELYAFNQRLSEKFTPEALNQAFIHSSYIIQEKQKQRELGIEEIEIDINDNEEFVNKGTEITSKVVYSYLQYSLPHVPEDGIWAIHDYLMSDATLADASKHLGTTDIILTEEHPPSEKTMAKTFLALVGALTECTDETHAGIFVRDFLLVALADKDLTEIWTPPNPYEMLNDILGKEDKALAEPRLIGQGGKNTLLAVYHVAVYSDKEFLGAGFGETVQEAKEAAAINALCRKFHLTDSSHPIQFDKVINMS